MTSPTAKTSILQVPRDFELLAVGNSANQNAEITLKFKGIFASEQKQIDRKTSHTNSDDYTVLVEFSRDS